ncbi:L,D-transpeptidase [Gemmobacter denitrificans]|uniref:L,D-transpeptidase n=1 Tax=Gemmobacter denitrificans TaxID=3123040 RepID=A0ABU8BWE5_9RHOB
MLTRRSFMAATAASGLAACMRPEPSPPLALPAGPAWPPLPAFYGAITTEPHPVPAVPEGIIHPDLWRQEVANPYPDDPPGSIVISPGTGFLYLLQSRDRALRYGAGSGAAAFSWSGSARVQFRRKWPVWKAPDSMIARRPEFAPYSVANGGMPGGPGNPLGARALYLFQNGQDTLYRIHGACEPKYLGKAVSSGCVRLLDQDVIDLHDRVRDGITVRVLPADPPPGFVGVY